ncbi:uncharacterized protein VTP21DRAFT_8892 [Calcarisporiella thermophila]|uniref:uncharacterized protein n=1 Tax=Calcarisporiella thermophila TaxID=911321 RepID=UPI003744742F
MLRMLTPRRLAAFRADPKHRLAIRLFTFLIFSAFSLLIVLYILFSSTPYTLFHRRKPNVTRGSRRMHEGLRFLESDDWIFSGSERIPTYHPLPPEKSLPTTAVPAHPRIRDVDICVVVVTVFRKHKQYLEYAIGSVLDTLSASEREKFHLALFVADPDPGRTLRHAARHNITRLVDTVFTYPCNHTMSVDGVPDGYKIACEEEKLRPASSIPDSQEGAKVFHRMRTLDIRNNHDAWVTKEIFDYAMVTRYCLEETNAPWCLVLEDDVVASEGWAPALRSALKEVERYERGELREPTGLLQGWPYPSSAKPQRPTRKAKSAGEIKKQGNKWIYLRLFYTEHLMGFGSEDQDTVVVLGYAALVSMCVGFLCQQWLKASPMRARIWWARPYNRLALLACCATIVGFIVLIPYSYGKQNLFTQKPGLTTRLFNVCCTPSLLYPRSVLPALSNHLLQVAANDTNKEPLDFLIETYAEEQNLARLTWVPSLFQHVGFLSSKVSDDLRTAFYSLSFERQGR